MTDNVETLAPPKGAAAYSHLKDKMGRLRTQSLFIEMKNPNYPAPFTLKFEDHKGSISMYRKYMEVGDPTEYSTAIALFGPLGWRHWQVLTKCEWFKPHLARWRSELKTKFESDRYNEMFAVSQSGNGTPAAVQATKWLADRYSKDELARGRPSKAEKAKLLKDESDEDKLLAEEAARLGL